MDGIIKKNQESGRLRRYGTVGTNGWMCISLPKATSYTVTEVRIYGGAVLNNSSTDGYTVDYSYPSNGTIALQFHGNAFTDCSTNHYNIEVIVDVS